MLETCCYTWELRVGAILVALASIALSIAQTCYTLLSDKDWLNHYPSDVKYCYFILTGLEALTVLSSILLLIGAILVVACLCIPFLVVRLIATGIEVAATFRLCLLTWSDLNLLQWFISFFRTWFAVYFFLVVLSFYSNI